MKSIRRIITERRCIDGFLPPIKGYVYDEIFAVHHNTYGQKKRQLH